MNMVMGKALQWSSYSDDPTETTSHMITARNQDF